PALPTFPPPLRLLYWFQNPRPKSQTGKEEPFLSPSPLSLQAHPSIGKDCAGCRMRNRQRSVVRPGPRAYLSSSSTRSAALHVKLAECVDVASRGPWFTACLRPRNVYTLLARRSCR